MDITTMQLISTIFLVLSAVFLAVAVIYFFVQRIPQVIGDLSGKNAAREIGRIREHNESGTGGASRLSDEKKADVESLLSAKHMPSFLPEYDRTTNHLTGGKSGQMSGSFEETGDPAYAETYAEPEIGSTSVLDEVPEIGATSVLGSESPEPVSYAEPEIGATSVLCPEESSMDEADGTGISEDEKPEGFDVLMELDYTQSTEIIS